MIKNNGIQKIKSMELPISITPEVRTYSYYALPQCIIMAEDRIGKRIAEFEIVDTDGDNWTSIGIKKDGSQWIYESEDKYNRFCNGCIYRPLSCNEGYVHIKINFQQESEPWAAINVFLTDDEENILLGDNEYICRFGNFIHDGVSLYYSGKKENLKERQDGRSGEFVLSLSKGKLESFFGQGKQIKKIGEKKISTTKKLYIGVQVKHNDNAFYPWLFSNFIQINCNIDCMYRGLDYYCFFRDERHDIVNYFLDYNYMTAEDLKHYGIVKTLKWELFQKRYVEMKLDQYYIEGRAEYYSKHFEHQTLIYGFDDQKKSFLLAGYTNDGKIQKFTIKYNEVEQSITRYPEADIKRISYCQGMRWYEFMPEYIQKVCKDYLEGKNTELDAQAYFPIEKERVYGMKIYEQLQTHKGISALVADRRLSYLLYEHKKLMAERLEYMRAKEMVDVELYLKLKNIANKLVKTSFNLMHTTQKYRFRPEKQNDELLRKQLQELEENDKKMMYGMAYEWKIR